MLAKFQKSAYRLLMKISAGWERKINVFAMKISAGWGEEIVLLMKVSVGWGGNCVVYGFSVG